MFFRMETLKNKLLARISIDSKTGCWDWTVGKNSYGYGQFRFKGKVMYAHRASFEIHCGPIPEGLFVCHRCDNRGCVNPSHLFVATNAGNTADRHAKGRNGRLIGAKQNGAKLTDSDVIAIRATTGLSQQRIAKRYGVSPSLISCIRLGKNWTHVS